MDTISDNIVELHIAGKNVTKDITPYLSKISYTDVLESESDDISLELEDTGRLWQQEWYPSQGDTLSLKLGYQGDLLDCGEFEIDQITFSLPPDTVTVSAIAAAITKELRTKNSKAFEKQTLIKIAEQIADKHGLELEGNLGEIEKITIDRKTQERQTDVGFLSALAKEHDLIFSVRGNKLILYTPEELEQEPVVATLDRSAISKATLTDKTSHVYHSAVVSHRDVRSKTLKQGEVEADNETHTADTLVVEARAEDDAQAKQKAEAALKKLNRDKVKGSITLPGNTTLVAGVNIELTDFGEFSGKWHITKSTHEVSLSGYTTKLDLRKIME